MSQEQFKISDSRPSNIVRLKELLAGLTEPQVVEIDQIDAVLIQELQRLRERQLARQL
jgi:hypothetical protein